ncbi:hypothetical protein PR003_g34516, partial [Phytophthora rubi]
MSPSYADTVKLVEDNYFHWEFNMRMKLSRKGLLAHIIKPEFDALSDRSTVQWKTNDLKALGVIAGDVSLTYQVYIRGATTAADSWRMLEEQFNRNTLKNRLIVTQKLHNFKMGSTASASTARRLGTRQRSAARRRPTRNADKSRGRHPTTRSRLRVRWASLNGSSTPVQA